MEGKFSGLEISALAAAVPKKEQRTSDFTDHFEKAEIERIVGATGIHKMRICAPEQTASDLCFAAAQKIFASTHFKPADIDGLVFVSPTPDYISNSTGAILQERLKLNQSLPVFDLAYGCSAFIYGLLQSAMMIHSGVSERVLLLCGESQSKNIDLQNRSTRFLFGDAGGAAVISRGHDDWFFNVGTQGSGHKSLIVEGKGYRAPQASSYLHMDGTEVMNFIARTVPEGIEQTLRMSGLRKDDIDRWYFHQANAMVSSYLEKKLGLPAEKMPSNLANFGNTGAGSIPLLISDFAEHAACEERIAVGGFGIGFSWGICLLRLNRKTVMHWIEV